MMIHNIDRKNTSIDIKQEKLYCIIIAIETFPNMLHQVYLKLLMNSSCMHITPCLQVCNKVGMSTMRYVNVWNVFVNMIIININGTILSMSFIFNNHIMQYNAWQYYVLHGTHLPITRWTTYNCEMRFKHTKCSLHILSCHFLTFCK